MDGGEPCQPLHLGSEIAGALPEEFQMLKEASFVDEWVKEGEERGRAAGLRRAVLLLLRLRFGDLSPAVIARVQNADAPWLESLVDRIETARSLQELGFD